MSRAGGCRWVSPRHKQQVDRIFPETQSQNIAEVVFSLGRPLVNIVQHFKRTIVVVVVFVDLTFTRVIKSVVTAHAPVLL